MHDWGRPETEAERRCASEFVRNTLAWSKAQFDPKRAETVSATPAQFQVQTMGVPEGEPNLNDLLRYLHIARDINPPTAQLLIVGRDSELGPPPRAWSLDADYFGDRHNILWDMDAGIALASDASRGIWAFADLRKSHFLLWIDSISALPSWERAAPIRSMIHWMTITGGGTLAHMAAFGADGVYIGLTGPSGVGKSTTTAAAVAEGFDILAEDLTHVEVNDDAVTAGRVYDSIKVTDAALDKFAFLRELSAAAGGQKIDKTVFPLPAPLGTKQPLSALFSLSGRFSDQVEIVATPKAKLFHRLAPATVFLLRTGGRLAFHRLGAMVRALPTFEVTPGADARETARAIHRFASALRKNK